jgi:hypothetical protein
LRHATANGEPRAVDRAELLGWVTPTAAAAATVTVDTAIVG